MVSVDTVIYILSGLVALLTVILFSRKIRRSGKKQDDPWQTSAPTPQKSYLAKERIKQPRVVPPPHLFRQP
ncbi:MAG: hypothetical protein CMA73_03765 [Euryarchaeota archaeon]|jgi:hypothetical protein|nr:hypothetical protein [Euryarchaeota archaeon]MBN74777.1 hypothetical protein [Euryarchaeota archaeon]MCH2642036.1 hypothetical protein [Candidatus Thalassarchaeum sp.]MED6298137.1 hypothetical protein [Candidatus Thermoplasmatota archaeon]GIS44295.1 MAG: hypothetical protein Ct9H90mP16_13650 [Candidatus Poseidoniales archaeon]